MYNAVSYTHLDVYKRQLMNSELHYVSVEFIDQLKQEVWAIS